MEQLLILKKTNEYENAKNIIAKYILQLNNSQMSFDNIIKRFDGYINNIKEDTII